MNNENAGVVLTAALTRETQQKLRLLDAAKLAKAQIEAMVTKYIDSPEMSGREWLKNNYAYQDLLKAIAKAGTNAGSGGC